MQSSESGMPEREISLAGGGRDGGIPGNREKRLQADSGDSKMVKARLSKSQWVDKKKVATQNLSPYCPQYGNRSLGSAFHCWMLFGAMVVLNAGLQIEDLKR